MKSQVFNEQQLEDLVAGKKVVVVEPKKKGEYEMDLCQNKKIHEIFDIDDVTISLGGEVVQAVNKKGEKIWNCSCKDKFHDYKPDSLGTKPLLVCLEKIEDKIVESVWKHSFDTDLENPDNRNYSRYRHSKKGINFKPKVNQEVRLKTWGKKE